MRFAIRGLGAARVRQVVVAGAIAVAFATALFALRLVAYGDWLPNTYYLKIDGWPLADRIAWGLERNAPLLPSAVVPWMLLAIPAVRRGLGGRALPVAAALGAYTLTVAYSIHNGGDAWRLHLGHDRYTAVGSIFLILAAALVVVQFSESRPWKWAVATVLCLAVVLDPAIRQPHGLQQHQRRIVSKQPPQRMLEWKWIRYGRHFRDVSSVTAHLR